MTENFTAKCFSINYGATLSLLVIQSQLRFSGRNFSSLSKTDLKSPSWQARYLFSFIDYLFIYLFIYLTDLYISKEREESSLVLFYRDNYNSLTQYYILVSSNRKIFESVPTPSKQVKEFDFILSVSTKNSYDYNVMQYAFTQHP